MKVGFYFHRQRHTTANIMTVRIVSTKIDSSLWDFLAGAQLAKFGSCNVLEMCPLGSGNIVPMFLHDVPRMFKCQSFF